MNQSLTRQRNYSNAYQQTKKLLVKSVTVTEDKQLLFHYSLTHGEYICTFMLMEFAKDI